MATTNGKEIRTVADIVKTVLNCSDDQANTAENDLIKSPSNLAKLLMACGLSTAAIGFGGFLIVSGPATAVEGVVISAAGLKGAKRFCCAAVKLDGVIPANSNDDNNY